MKKYFFLLFQVCFAANVKLGIEVFFEEQQDKKILKEKNIGIITNHTGIDSSFKTTLESFFNSKDKKYSIKAIFSPEHGINGQFYAGEKTQEELYKDIPVYSLHGKNKRPTPEMLKNIDVLIFDIQDLGSRSYTYLTTLFYVMEEAQKNKIEVIVLDRPNPMNGLVVDGPMLEEKYRSFLGYINVPYCHGMTIGELSEFFNKEYKINCKLTVIPMKGWKRWMSFADTGLIWIPTSPNIPEADTAFFYPSTGVLGELNILSIGIGYTQPFKIVGAPWIEAKSFADKLNEQNLPGVKFIPIYFRPFYGAYKGENCQGVKIIICDHKIYKPFFVQYMILGMFKSLYPKHFEKLLNKLKPQEKETFNKVNGTQQIYNILIKEPFPAWKMIEFQEEQKKEFLKKREGYLFAEYAGS